MISSPGVWLGLLLAPCAVCGADAPTAAPPAKAASRWAEIEAATGAMQLDGTLRLDYPLGSGSELRQLGFVCELRHGVETDVSGRVRTVWHFRGFQSSLAPTGRERLRWRSPTGASVEFERAEIGRAFAEAGSSRWLIREFHHGGTGHEIRTADGRVWRFHAGLPIGVEDPALGSFALTTQGAWLREIRRNDASGGTAPLLRASYDEAGRLRTCAFDAAAPQRFDWDEAGRLTAWQRADGQTVHFAYRNGLLAAVTEPDRPIRHFTWAENPGHRRGDSRWAAPARLVSDGVSAYDYTLSAQGFTLRRRTPGGDPDVLTIFNPRRRRVEQRTKAETLMVTFRGGPSGRGALEKIENGRGEILEAYRYDERGQLIGVRRKGEPERALSYDEAGRLMALEEKP